MLNRLISRLKMRLNGLKSPALRERMYRIDVNGTPHEVQHSRFNLNWLPEAGIDPKVIVDLGSFDGGDAWRTKQTFPNARVITVEADPDRINIVRAALAASDVEIYNFAACDQDGPVEWYTATVNGETNAQGSLYQHSDAYQKRFTFVKQAEDPIEVDGKRFDTFCAEAGIDGIDLLHMDIEGAELSVLRSIGKVRPKLIYLEWREDAFRGHEGTASAETLLHDLGYSLLGNLGDDRLYRHQDA